MLDSAQTSALASEFSAPTNGWDYSDQIANGQDATIADLMNGAGKAGDVLPPSPYSVQQLMIALGPQGIGELTAANLLGLFQLAGPSFDLGNAQALGVIQALLHAGNCAHALSVLDQLAQPTACTHAEFVFQQRGVTVHHLDVAMALRPPKE